MTEILRGDTSLKGAYERPEDKWVCGKARLGRPCRHGPSTKGGCQMAFECDPVRDGASWTCSRPLSAGGPCAKGPGSDGLCALNAPPCVPRKSLRKIRGALTLWLSLITLGLLTLLLGSSWGRHVIDPGPMIQGHGELQDCKTCHVAFDGSWSHWVLAAFRPNDPLADSRKCQTCHERGADPLRPHSMPSKMLAEHTKDIKATAQTGGAPLLHWMSDRFFERENENEAALACTTCHKEHKGPTFEASMVADDRCQGCHNEKFPSLAEGHPPFQSYPYMRRSRLAFDHHKHFRKNFADAKVEKDKVPKTCATCHLPDQSGRFMLVQSFEQTCANCHSKDIEGESVAGARGIAVLGIPALDLETLHDRGHDVGRWPELAQADDLTPFVKLLLADDPKIAADLKQMAGLDLEDLSAASAAQLATVRRVAWALKELFFDLTVSGSETVQLRLAKQLEGGIDKPALGRLLGNIPLDVIKAARRAWFPGLKKEVLQYREEKAAHFDFEAEPRVRLAMAATDDETAALLSFLFAEPAPPKRQSPKGILLAQAAGDLLNDSEGLLDKDSLRLNEYQELLEEDSKSDNSLFKAKQPAPAPSAKKTEPKQPEPAKAEKKAPEPPKQPALAKEKAPQVETATTESTSQEKAETKPAETKPAKAAPAKPELAESKPAESEPEPPEEVAEVDEPLDPNLDPEIWAKLGGWYRRDETLFYRAVTHRDPFMGAWLDLAAALHGTPAEDMGRPLLAVFRAKNTPGKCTKCHSIDRLDNGVLTVNWQPFAPDPRRQTFTTFNHTAHFSLVEKKGCITCHQVEPEARFAASYEDFDAAAFASNFKPMDREVCADCHVQESAGDACIQCHRYHVGEFPLTPVHTLIADMPLTTVDPAALKQTATPKQIPAAEASEEAVPPQTRETASIEKLGPVDWTTEPLSIGVESLFDKATIFQQSSPAPLAKAGPSGKVVIQFASVRSLESAWGEQARVKKRFADLLSGQKVTVQKVELENRGTFYRVMAESFPDTKGAQKVCDRLKQQDQACLVVLRSAQAAEDKK